MKLELLKVGHCFHPEAIVTRGGSWKAQQFPAVVGLLTHPTQGHLLFDTGYASHFLHATQPFPQRFYRWLTPMHLPPVETLHQQLRARNIDPHDIRGIVISHFHADHIAGLHDFPHARFYCSKDAFHAFTRRKGMAALLKGELAALIPSDFARRAIFFEDCPKVTLPKHYAPFQHAFDLFNDGSSYIIPLPGHAAGHVGLLIPNPHRSPEKSLFLVADACWTHSAMEKNKTPHPIAHLILDDKHAYYDTISRLAQLHHHNGQIQIIPSHCQTSFERFQCI